MSDAILFHVFLEECFRGGSSTERYDRVRSYRGLCTERSIDKSVSLVDVNPPSAADNLGRYLADLLVGKIRKNTEGGSRVLYPECRFLFTAPYDAVVLPTYYTQTEGITDSNVRVNFLEAFHEKYTQLQEERR